MSVKVDPEILAELARKKAKHICAGCGKTFPQSVKFRRLLHPGCYVSAMRAIKERRVTASELIRKGNMAPRGKGGRPATNEFTRSLQDR